MKEQLKNYIDLLFAGAPEAADIKNEILQNTLDRYDDLIGQGKTPQAAYQLAISGIGDINEILGSALDESETTPAVTTKTPEAVKPAWKKVLQAVGVCLYILCVIPLFVLQNTAGLCGMFVFIAVATALMIISSGKESEDKSNKENVPASPQLELHKAVKSIINTVGICTYLCVSFITQAWYITWIIFPIMAAVNGLVRACMDLKEANNNEA